MNARIVIIFHESFRGRDPRTAAIHHLAKIWSEEGLDVVFAYGVRALPEADLAILHCDLSVVPEQYRRAAEHYPIVLNGRIHDIRKSALSQNLVTAGDSYEGPVMVKTDLNAAGRPERRALPRRLRALRRAASHLGWESLSGARRKTDYRVFDCTARVPARVWRDSRFVVERFLPERSEVGYAVHSCFVLGRRRICERAESSSPVVCDATAVRIENVSPYPSIAERCDALRLDYGKLDYTLSKGECVILDVNKTVGASATGQNAELQANRRFLASGVYDYLEGRIDPL